MLDLAPLLCCKRLYWYNNSTSQGSLNTADIAIALPKSSIKLVIYP